MIRISTFATILCCIVLFAAPFVQGQTTDFTFQGSLQNSSAPANGNFDFEFALFDSLAGGSQLGSTLTRSSVAVANGTFAVKLDFGSQFPGANRFLEIRVRQTGGGAYTPLTPRQAVNSTPYSVKSLNADTATTATNATQLGGVEANQFVVTTDPRMTDARTPTAGSSNYIQNTAVQQAASNFNITGNGTVGGALRGNIVRADTQFNIGVNRVLSTGQENMFVGLDAGISNTTGSANSFFGRSAGASNTTGTGNSFFGRSSGGNTTVGEDNSFFGRIAGQSNTTGFDNSFFGSSAGQGNTTGSNNSFFGRQAGLANSIGELNSFFGRSAGRDNTVGVANSFFGYRAGENNIGGDSNTFIGQGAGTFNTSGNNNSFLGDFAGSDNTSGDGNTFLGRSAGFFNTTGNNNTIIGSSANLSTSDLTFATAIGAGSSAGISNSISLGRSGGQDTVFVPGDLQVSNDLDVIGASTLNTLIVTLGAAGVVDVCRNPAGQLSTCSSSLRYKNNVTTFSHGLSVVRRLRPISFRWNNSRIADVGFGAEEVAEVEPLLATYNDKGEIEGVKYKQITTVLVNAVKEQQAQIEAQNAQIEVQQAQIAAQQVVIDQLKKKVAEFDALKAYICSQSPGVQVCKP